MRYRITLIPGDGIGPEVTDAVLHVLAHTPLEIEWDRHEAGVAVFDWEGTPLPDRVLDSIRQNRVALEGPIGTPIGGGFSSVNIQIR
jgi:isocitrate dehydrogenase (NAD+)